MNRTRLMMIGALALAAGFLASVYVYKNLAARNGGSSDSGVQVMVAANDLQVGARVEERDIRTNPDYLRILTEELDSRTTPTLVLADKIIVGFDRAEYERLTGSAGTKRKRQAVRGRA